MQLVEPNNTNTEIVLNGNELCNDTAWLKISKALFERRELGFLSRAEFDCYIFLFSKANPKRATFITNFTEISHWLGLKLTRSREILSSLKDKKLVFYASSQGKQKFTVFINFYPLMKDNPKDTQRYSYFGGDFTENTYENREVEQNSAKLYSASLGGFPLVKLKESAQYLNNGSEVYRHRPDLERDTERDLELKGDKYNA